MPDVITIDQMRDLIKAEKIKPSDLFGAEALADDPSVKGYVDAKTKEAVSGEYAHRKRTEEGFDKTKADLEKKIQDGETEIKKLKLEAAKSQVGSLFEKQKTDRKLDEKQVKFIENRLPKFAPSKPEELEKEFNAYLDAEIDDYKKIAKDVFGVEDGGEPGGKPGGSEPDDQKKKGQIDNKYLDPTQNPLIKTD